MLTNFSSRFEKLCEIVIEVWSFLYGAAQRCAFLVDLEKGCRVSICIQKPGSEQPREIPPKFDISLFAHPQVSEYAYRVPGSLFAGQ